jgi:hypothetical protein
LSANSGVFKIRKLFILNHLYSMAVDGVCREPLSGPNSLLTGKFTGNSQILMLSKLRPHTPQAGDAERVSLGSHAIRPQSEQGIKWEYQGMGFP